MVGMKSIKTPNPGVVPGPEQGQALGVLDSCALVRDDIKSLQGRSRDSPGEHFFIKVLSLKWAARAARLELGGLKTSMFQKEFLPGKSGFKPSLKVREAFAEVCQWCSCKDLPMMS